MKTIETKILGLIVDLCKDAFRGFFGRIRMGLLKRKLSRDISRSILDRYGSQPYYNELDHFLDKHDVICSIIRNCYFPDPFEFKTKTQTIKYYVSLFVDDNKKYKVYSKEISELISEYFVVIHNCLNPIKTESARSLCNALEQIVGELSERIANIDHKIDVVLDKLDNLQINAEIPSSFSVIAYFRYLLDLINAFIPDEYLQRSFYDSEGCKNENELIRIINEEKRLLLLGYAGYGKTQECIRLLNRLLDGNEDIPYIPFMLSLFEYGVFYQDIYSGIKYKTNSFYEGDLDEVLNSLLKSHNCLLIFDGVDDISTDSLRRQFIWDLNDFCARYRDVSVLVTARPEISKSGLNSFVKYHLAKIDDVVVRQQLCHEGVMVDVPQSIYELLSNPFYLTIGKTIIKRHNHFGNLFNQSELMLELFVQMYGERKRIKESGQVSYYEAIELLGKYAYDNYTNPSTSLVDFDKFMYENIPEKKSQAIDSFFSSGIINCENGITFSHKLFKAFFAAHHLINAYPLIDNIDLYVKMIDDDKWMDVLVFAGGLINSIEDQDRFLDLIMENNLPLYIKCVYAKSDLHAVEDNDGYSTAVRLLSNILNSYLYIRDNYFEPLINRFSPTNSLLFDGYKVGIVGSLGQNKNSLIYWLDLVPVTDEAVICIDWDELIHYREEAKRKALIQNRSIVINWINLSSYGFSEESGRAIAISLVKNEISRIIDNRELDESEYLLCERIKLAKMKITEIKDVDGLSEMEGIVEEMISKVHPRPIPLSFIYERNGVDLVSLLRIIQRLNANGVEYNQCILPQSDLNRRDGETCFLWDLYSKNCLMKRVSDCLFFYGRSYRKMVQSNFPKLCQCFSRYQDYPYQLLGVIDFKEEMDKHTLSSEPEVSYYSVASNEENLYPRITDGKINEIFDNKDEILQQIRDSYTRCGKVAYRECIAFTGVSSFLYNRVSGTADPLSPMVYEAISKSISEVFGDMG